MQSTSRIFVAGHRGLVGSAIVRALQAKGFSNLLLRTRQEVDLISQAAVNTFFEKEKPEYVFLAAAKVGGILANSNYPADFIRDNLFIASNVIDAAYRFGSTKLCFLGSSCIYPKFAPQPMKEEHLLTGVLEPTNEPYAIAKIAGLKMVEAYRKQYGFDGYSLMPTNLYGPNDNFDPQNSHVLPALIRRFYEAKSSNAPSVVIWGTGTPKREFLHCDDLAECAVHTMLHHKDGSLLNVGVGEDISIADLARLVAKSVDYSGAIEFDTSKPDGTPRKLLDVSRAHAIGWKAKIPLEQGIREAAQWYIDHRATK